MNSLISQTNSCSLLRSLARWFWLSSFYAAHHLLVLFLSFDFHHSTQLIICWFCFSLAVICEVGFVSLLQWFAKWLANESDLMPFVIRAFCRRWDAGQFDPLVFVVFVQCWYRFFFWYPRLRFSRNIWLLSLQTCSLMEWYILTASNEMIVTLSFVILNFSSFVFNWDAWEIVDPE
jgi:hypothetical protein